MVVFTCDACNEALKKNKVAFHKHQNTTFTCIDCHVTFSPLTYAEHNKCISEAERYGGTGYVAKANKGEVKQEDWMNTVRAAVKKMRYGETRDIMNKVLKHGNIPRKKKPFVNFLKSACHIDPAKGENVFGTLMMLAYPPIGTVPFVPSDEKKTEGETNGNSGDANDAEEAAPVEEETSEKPKKKKNLTAGDAETLELAEAVAEDQTTEKKKRKHKKEAEEEEPTEQPETEPAEKKKKKKKSLEAGDAQEVEEAAEPEEELVEKKKKKKKRQSEESGSEEAAEQEPTEEPTEKKKKKKRHTEEIEAQPEVEPVQELTEKKKKKKRAVEEEDEEAEEIPTPKKSKKNKHAVACE